MYAKRIILLITLFFQLYAVQAAIVVLNGLTHQYKIEQGVSYKGMITLQNTLDTPQSVKLYLTDYTYRSDGTSYYDDPQDNPRSNARWIDLNTTFLTLQGKEKIDLFYEIAAPQNITEAGSYWSVVMIEPVDDVKPSDDKPGIKIRSVVRYAVQIITNFEEENAKSLFKFEDVQVTTKEGKKMMEISLANEGELFHKVTASVEFFDHKEGTAAGFFESDSMGLLPGGSKKFFIDITDVSIGEYSAVVLVTGENDTVFGLNVELTIQNE